MPADNIPRSAEPLDAKAEKKLEDELDGTLGMRYWQLFYAVFFWSNIATPLNLAINILAAVTTAQASDTGTNIPPVSRVKGVSIALTVLATLNSFLRPTTQVADYLRLLTAWREFGAEFEDLYYAEMTVPERCKAYRELLSKVNKFDAPSVVQPVTETLASLLLWMLRRDKFRWLQITNPDIYAGTAGAGSSHVSTTASKFFPGCFGCLPAKRASRKTAAGSSTAVSVTATAAGAGAAGGGAADERGGDGNDGSAGGVSGGKTTVAASLSPAGASKGRGPAGPSTSSDGTSAASDAV